MPRPSARRSVLATAMAALVGLATIACATNPVTGKRELSLISETQEIALGRQADKEAVAAYGLYQDEALQRYVQTLGTSIAARTERPNLSWTFRVVDDHAVNAFAIPGGFIYVTRGILTHLNSEAELAGILGHEIGHVTARHSVNQMSKQQLAQIGLVAGMVLSPEVARFGNLLQTGVGLLFLKYSRDDERQADQLGLRYMVAGGYDPRRLVNVFQMLEGVGKQEGGGGGRLPEWLSTHPDPGNRLQWASTASSSVGRDVSQLAVNEESYLRRLDGIVFGENPREGIFQGTLFRHPDLAFQMQFPPGWRGSNQKQAVGAVSPKEDAVVALQLAEGSSAQQAARRFFSQQGIVAGEPWRREIGGFPAVSGVFSAQTEQGNLRGLAAFVEHGNRVYQLLGYTSEQRWNSYRETFMQSLASFKRETDREILNVQPRRMNVVEVTRTSTPDALFRQYPSTVAEPVVNLINQLEPGSTVRPGQMYKQVVGGPRF
ncbi:MAG: M48 family metalloprotease [Vicinamibacterales bacterium]